MPAARALHDLPPPLQADQRQMRLRRHLPRAGEFVVEGVQRQQRIPPPGRREQRGQEPVGIMPPNQRGDRFVHLNTSGRNRDGCPVCIGPPGEGGAEAPEVVQG